MLVGSRHVQESAFYAPFVWQSIAACGPFCPQLMHTKHCCLLTLPSPTSAFVWAGVATVSPPVARAEAGMCRRVLLMLRR